MNSKAILTVALGAQSHSYNIEIGANLLPAIGSFARQYLPAKATRAVIVSNRKVFNLYGATTVKSLQTAGFAVSTFLMPDGERHKNFKVLQKTLDFFSAQKLTRSDAVIALGGGVIGDLAGFAAAVFQRGVAFLQIPTTFLSQIDSSVGGKTAVNTAFGKNLIGAFHQPHAVLIDVDVLQTLARRELCAGFYEAVKHGAIGDRQLFEQTKDFLQQFPLKKFKQFFASRDKHEFIAQLQGLIAANIKFKISIVTGDEREDANRFDARSRKILNFGHTVGHALERATGYKRFKHGEAVAFGMLAAANLSKKLGKINQSELNLFCDVVRSVGKLPAARDIPLEAVTAAFSHDKKSIGNSFSWILLGKIGLAEIADNQNIPEEFVCEAVKAALKG